MYRLLPSDLSKEPLFLLRLIHNLLQNRPIRREPNPHCPCYTMCRPIPVRICRQYRALSALSASLFDAIKQCISGRVITCIEVQVAIHCGTNKRAPVPPYACQFACFVIINRIRVLLSGAECRVIECHTL